MENKTAIRWDLKILFGLLFLISLNSCIPLKVAPKISEGKVMQGKKFHRFLPKQYIYVFNDPKDANEFYYYINAKFDIDYDILGGNIPLKIGDNDYLISFYEIDRDSKIINLLPLVVDMALESHGQDPIYGGVEVHRTGYWYIALTVNDHNFGDMLEPNNPEYNKVLGYLDSLRREYLFTANYLEVFLKNQIEVNAG